MGIKRIVDTSFWTDGKVDDFTPEDKYFMLYLLTNPFSKQLGIYEVSIKQMAFQMGYSVDAVKALIDRFENKYKMIVFSKETNEIAILNFLRHSVMKGGAPVRDCLVKEIRAVKNKELIARVFSHIKNYDNINETVKAVIAEYEEQNGILYYCNEYKNDNENDNDNERTVDVSCNDTYHDTCNDTCNDPPEKPSKRFVKPSVDEIRAYCAKRGNKVDAQKFFDYYDTSGWVDGKGKPVRNWKQKVITWEGRDKNGVGKGHSEEKPESRRVFGTLI